MKGWNARSYHLFYSIPIIPYGVYPIHFTSPQLNSQPHIPALSPVKYPKPPNASKTMEYGGCKSPIGQRSHSFKALDLDWTCPSGAFWLHTIRSTIPCKKYPLHPLLPHVESDLGDGGGYPLSPAQAIRVNRLDLSRPPPPSLQRS